MAAGGHFIRGNLHEHPVARLEGLEIATAPRGCFHKHGQPISGQVSGHDRLGYEASGARAVEGTQGHIVHLQRYSFKRSGIARGLKMYVKPTRTTVR